MANTLKFGNGQWATGNGTALAYNDENANFKPLPFDFTRASSGTTVNQSGLIETVGSGIPRIDFQGNTKGALVLEPQRLNRIPNSDEFSGSETNVSVSRNQVISPDGTLNADRVLDNNINGEHLITGSYSGSITSGLDYTASVFFKSDGTGGKGVIRFYIGAWNNAVFNLDNGTISYTSSGVSKIENYGNGWYRCSLKSTAVSNYGNTIVQIAIANSSNQFSYQGTSSLGNYFWGAQFEEGSYATPYIPTSGSAVTRVADSCSQLLPNAVPTSGTIYTEIELFDSVLNSSSSNIRFGLNFGNSTSDWLFFGIESGDNLRTYIRANSANSFDNTLNGVFTTAGVYKIAMRFATNDSKVFVNGIQKSSSTGSVIASNLNNLNIGGGISNNAILNSIKTKDFKLYNTALTDAELVALTQ